MDFISNLSTDLTKSIASFMDTEEEKLHFALTVPGGEEVYYNLRKDPEYWLKRIEDEYQISVPKKYSEDVTSLERFYMILSGVAIEGEKPISKTYSSMIPEVLTVIRMLLEKGDIPVGVGRDQVKYFPSSTIDNVIKVYVDNVVMVSLSLVEVLFELLRKKEYEEFVSDHQFYYDTTGCMISSLYRNGKTDEIPLALNISDKYWPGDYKKEYIEEYFSTFPYYDYENAKKLKEVVELLKTQGYSAEFGFQYHKGKDPKLINGDFYNTFYFPEFSLYIMKVSTEIQLRLT